MTIEELREVVQPQEELLAERQRHKEEGGYYVGPPPIPHLNQYRERLDILETQLQEEQDRLEQHRQVEEQVRQQEAAHLAEVQVRRQAAAEPAEKEHRDELERQAAMTETPEEQIAQEQERVVPPLIGAIQGIPAQVINSSSESTRLLRQEEEDERVYWDNIVDIKYTTYNVEIDEDELLHEGVLYWMSMEDIKDLRERARSKKDPDAEKQFKEYIDNNIKLDMKMREENEKYKGAIEEREDFQQALEDRDSEAIQEIFYEYAKGARERKAQRRIERLKDDEKKKEAWLREVLREQSTIQEGAATSSATSTAQGSTEERKKTPPRPNREPPVPASQRVPATPA
eukprot:4634625-Amphidinium_carterae.1